MIEAPQLEKMERQGRTIEPAVTGDDDLGPFKLLPGTWANEPNLVGRGWNMIALPFAVPGATPGAPPETGSHPSFRLLLNQYNEVLKFNLVDKAVPNRGMNLAAPNTVNSDQLVVTLDYEQSIKQIVAEDFPASGLAGAPKLPIHHEPGLFLNMSDPNNQGGPDIARLATIPHGDAALGLGNASFVDNPTTDIIPTINSLPIGVSQDLANNRYLAPYKHFMEPTKFRGLFDPTDPTALLKLAMAGENIVRTTVLEFDTTVATGGINNIPFIVEQANASEMKATFFIHELAENDADGNPKLLLQYAQVVQLDFLPRFDGGPGRIKWPHVSINTLEKISDVPDMQYIEVSPGTEPTGGR